MNIIVESNSIQFGVRYLMTIQQETPNIILNTLPVTTPSFTRSLTQYAHGWDHRLRISNGSCLILRSCSPIRQFARPQPPSLLARQKSPSSKSDCLAQAYECNDLHVCWVVNYWRNINILNVGTNSSTKRLQLLYYMLKYYMRSNKISIIISKCSYCVRAWYYY
jgi:hypothetical protein